MSDIDIARAAAAEQAKLAGYPQLVRPYLAGEWDDDAEVQSALIAVRLTRRADSITVDAA